MDCAALDERLADYLEGDLDPATRREVEAHVASCVRCTALVRDLASLRAAAVVLPELTPSRDLWTGIARRIETPVVPLASRPVPNVSVARPTFDLKRAAIAAALVAVTAGVTYTLTVAQNGRRNTSSSIASVAPGDTNTLPSVTNPARPDSGTQPDVAGVDSNPTSPAPNVSSPRGSTQSVNNAPLSDSYSREIDRLRTIFARNRSQLDPRTAAIIETNLRVIDEAIAQSRAALAQDPASAFLKDQLKSARDKKLELLKTAAFLPSST
jgi:hypothetical protein